MRLRFVGRERAMKLARRLYDEKQMTLPKIVLELRARGCRNERGKTFGAHAVRTMLGEARIKALRELTLTDAEVKAICTAVDEGYARMIIAQTFGVPRSVITAAVRRGRRAKTLALSKRASCSGNGEPPQSAGRPPPTKGEPKCQPHSRQGRAPPLRRRRLKSLTLGPFSRCLSNAP